MYRINIELVVKNSTVHRAAMKKVLRLCLHRSLRHAAYQHAMLGEDL